MRVCLTRRGHGSGGSHGRCLTVTAPIRRSSGPANPLACSEAESDARGCSESSGRELGFARVTPAGLLGFDSRGHACGAQSELTLRLRLTTLEAKTGSGRGVPNRLWLRQTPVFIIAGARKLVIPCQPQCAWYRHATRRNTRLRYIARRARVLLLKQRDLSADVFGNGCA